MQIRIRELERLLISGDVPAPAIDSHNSNLPPSLNPSWKKPNRTRSLRTKSGRPIGGVPGHQGFTLRQVSEPDLVIVQRVNVCQHCQYSLIQIESIRFHKRQIFEIENGSLFVTEHQAEVKLCPLCRQISKGNFSNHLKTPMQYRTSVFSRIIYLNQYQLLSDANYMILNNLLLLFFINFTPFLKSYQSFFVIFRQNLRFPFQITQSDGYAQLKNLIILSRRTAKNFSSRRSSVSLDAITQINFRTFPHEPVMENIKQKSIKQFVSFLTERRRENFIVVIDFDFHNKPLSLNLFNFQNLVINIFVQEFNHSLRC